MGLVNPVVRRLVRRGRAGGQLLVLHLTGRRTGRRYDVPAGYHLVDGVPTVFTNSGWRHNCAGGAEVEVTFRGRRRPAHAELVTDPATVAAVYQRLIEEMGWRAAQRRMGIRITVGRTPTLEELQDAVSRSGLSLIRLELH
ncbi:nitroreductase/quinone reductase family protein [Geodermatophilus sp. SYSU D00710]